LGAELVSLLVSLKRRPQWRHERDKATGYSGIEIDNGSKCFHFADGGLIK